MVTAPPPSPRGDLATSLGSWAAGDPEAPALTDEDAMIWSRRRLAARINQVGHGLAQLGLRRGDRVAVLAGASRDYLIADYGVMAAGMVRVPLDPKLSAAELAAQLADCEPRALIAAPPAADLAARAAAVCSTAGRGVAVIADPLDEWLDGLPATGHGPADPGAVASLNYTGGTTDQPKGVILRQANLAAVVGRVLQRCPVRAGDVFLNVRPLWPISAVTVLIRMLGGAHIVLDRFDPSGFAATVERHHVTSTSLVPTQLVRVLDAGPDLKRLTSLRLIDIGAAAIPPDVLRDALRLFGPRLGVNYGLTEAPWTCYLPPEELADGTRPGRGAGSVGRPLPGYQVVIQAPDGTPLAPGKTGEVTISGPHVMAGYWGRADLTDAALAGGAFHSGDLGFTDDDGYLRLVGRSKDVIRTGGKTVLPLEVEQALLAHPGIAEATVFGVPDREWGEVVTAWVVPRPGPRPSEEQLINHTRSRLSSFKKPRIIRFVDELPKSHYGKVLKARVRELELGGSRPGDGEGT